MMRSKIVTWSFVLTILLFFVACSNLQANDTLPAATATAIPIADASNETIAISNPAGLQGDVNSATNLQESLVALYQRVNPSVVHIFVYEAGLPRATGSGFVFDDQKHIVTNNHVVEGGDRYEIAFPGGARVSGKVIGSDVDSDLAVLELESVPEGVQPLPLASFENVQVGQLAVAIGNPFGQESSMSLGIVSGLGRSLRSQRILEGGGQYSLPQVIQTDAPINPGNSGGPLLNLQGEVIGINAAIRSDTATNSGVGFSIPVSAIARIVPVLIRDGKYNYPYLGVSVFDGIDLETQKALGLPQANGAYVTTVMPDGPAGEAGVIGSGGNNLSGGDLIVGIDDTQVNTFGDLISYLVFHAEVGQTVTLKLLRDGQEIQLPVVLGARP